MSVDLPEPLLPMMAMLSPSSDVEAHPLERVEAVRAAAVGLVHVPDRDAVGETHVGRLFLVPECRRVHRRRAAARIADDASAAPRTPRYRGRGTPHAAWEGCRRHAAVDTDRHDERRGADARSGSAAPVDSRVGRATPSRPLRRRRRRRPHPGRGVPRRSSPFHPRHRARGAVLVSRAPTAPIPALAACLVLLSVPLALFAPGIVLATAITMFGVANRDRPAGRTDATVAAAAIVVILPLSLVARSARCSIRRSFQFARCSPSRPRPATRRAAAASTCRPSPNAPSAPSRRRDAGGAARASPRSACASPATCTTPSRTRSPSSACNAGVASSALRVAAREGARGARHASGGLAGRARARSATCSRCSAPKRRLRRRSDGRRSPAWPGSTSSCGSSADSGLHVTVRVDGDTSRLPGAVDLVALSGHPGGTHQRPQARRRAPSARARRVGDRRARLHVTVVQPRRRAAADGRRRGGRGLLGASGARRGPCGDAHATAGRLARVALRRPAHSRLDRRRRDGPLMITVLVVDDQALIRQAVADILSSEPGISVVGEAVNGARGGRRGTAISARTSC